MRPEEIDDLLRSEEVLVWRPELTAAVSHGIRRDRIRTRRQFAAAAALILLAAGIGGIALLNGLGPTGIGSEIAARIPPPETARTSIGAGWTWVTAQFETAAAPLDLLPRGPGVAPAVAALMLLFLVNGATLGRPALARWRNS